MSSLHPNTPPHHTAKVDDGSVALWAWSLEDAEPLEVGEEEEAADLIWNADHIVMSFDLPKLPHRLVLLLATFTGAGRPEVIRMEINSRIFTDSYQPITSTNLRELPVSRLVADWLPAFAARLSDEGSAELTVDDLEVVRNTITRRSGRTPRTDKEQLELLEQIATAYRDAVIAGDRSPNLTLHKQLGYSRSHIARLVSQARKAGLLKPARPGQAGETR